MPAKYETELYARILGELNKVRIIDCHEHLMRDRDFPTGDDMHIGRFFLHYASSDLVAAGMLPEDLAKVKEESSLSPRDRWELLEPWYRKAWNTAYCEALRIALRDIYGVDDFSSDTVEGLADTMREKVVPGFTREVFDMAGIDYAMENVGGTDPAYNTDFLPECFIPDMLDAFTPFPVGMLAKASGIEILTLDDYLSVIDWFFDRDGDGAPAFKVGRAYNRPLFFDDVTKADAERLFNARMQHMGQLGKAEQQALEDFTLHYLCRKCGEYGVRMKFHTGLQEGNSNDIKNSRAGLLTNLFMRYPDTKFDIYHISYPYQEELTAAAKNFRNVSVDFCWMWIINPAAARRALSDMLDAIPANKIHGFGGDYIFVEGTYGHAKIARREIARVLCEKVEEGRFSEEYAAEVGRMLLRDNAIENFDLTARRERFIARLTA